MTVDEVVERYLVGLSCPCGKGQVVAWAQLHGASREVIEWLRKLPSVSYGSLDQVRGFLEDLPPLVLASEGPQGPRIRPEEETAGQSR